jgi:hypothetical protein
MADPEDGPNQKMPYSLHPNKSEIKRINKTAAAFSKLSFINVKWDCP